MLAFSSVNTLRAVLEENRSAPTSITPSVGRSTSPSGWLLPGDSADYSSSHRPVLIAAPPAPYNVGGCDQS